MVGMIAGRPAISVTPDKPTLNSVPMVERDVKTSPTLARPRACNVARLAELPVPQAGYQARDFSHAYCGFEGIALRFDGEVDQDGGGA